MLFWVSAGAVFLLDRLTKLLIVNKLQYGESIPIIDGFLYITYIRNPGAAFGILADKTWFFILVSIVILAVILYLAYNLGGKNPWLQMTLGMLAGGAGGNLADRLQTGLVIDFMDFRGIWPFIFNVADSAIVIAVIILAWQIIVAEQV